MFDLFENVIDLAQSKKTGGAALPFGETTTVKEVLAEQEITLDRAGACTLPAGAIPLEAGKTYTVMFNGVEYTSVAVDSGYIGVVIGNPGPFSMGEFTDEPYAICTVNEYDGGCEIRTVDYYESTATISISGEVTEVKKISGKYVEGMGYKEPERIAFIENFTINATKDNYQTPGRTVINVPYDFEQGKNYTVIFDGAEYEVTATHDELDVILGGIYTENLPFTISYSADSDAFGVTVRDKGEHTLSVFGMVDVVRPIKKEFIPPLAGFLYHDGTDNGYFYSDPELVNAVGMLDIVSMLKQSTVYLCSAVDGKTINQLVVEWDYTFYESFGGYGLNMTIHNGKVYGM